MIIILMGPPGAGKGSQASLIEEHYKIPHISTGNMFRENFKNETAIGKLAKEYIDQGHLVPDNLTNDIVRERLSRKDVKKGFMLDGYPRNLAQAISLDKLIKRNGWKVDYVINISVDEEVLLRRITGRRVCPNCGAVYHVDTKKPQHEGICDVCATPLIQRVDDTVETVKTRIDIYNEATKTLIDYYGQQGILVNVRGNDSIDETFDDVKKILGWDKWSV